MKSNNLVQQFNPSIFDNLILAQATTETLNDIAPGDNLPVAVDDALDSPQLVPLSEAMELLTGVTKIAYDAISTFNYLITVGGAVALLIVGFLFLIVGRQGDKLKEELLAKQKREEDRADSDRVALREHITEMSDTIDRQLAFAIHQVEDFKTEAGNFRKEQLERQNTLEANVSSSQRQIQNSVDTEFKRLNDRLPTEIERLVLKKSLELEVSLDGLVHRSEALQEKLNALPSSLLQRLETLQEMEKEEILDPYADYTFVSDFRPNDPEHTPEKVEELRRECVRRLERIIKAGEKGGVDTNLLFNAGMDASRIELEDLGLKLFTLSNEALSTTSHKLAMFRMQMTVGRRYEVVDGVLKEKKITSKGDGTSTNPIVNEAFRSALEAASNAPLEQNEIIYAELWNMAQKVREDKGYIRMLDTMLASYRARKGEEISASDFRDARDADNFDKSTWDAQKGGEIPSNLPGKISSIYALIGTGDWRKNYEKFLIEGLKIAGEESTMTTWRKPFIRDTKNTASRLGTMEFWKEHAEKAGIDESDGPVDLSSLPPGLLEALGNMSGSS